MKRPDQMSPENWTLADESSLQATIADEPDEWEATDEEMALARPFAEVFPDLAASIRRDQQAALRKRGKLA